MTIGNLEESTLGIRMDQVIFRMRSFLRWALYRIFPSLDRVMKN